MRLTVIPELIETGTKSFELPLRSANYKNKIGFCASVCYAEDFKSKSIADRLLDAEDNLARYDKIIDIGHYSVADHQAITVYIEGVSKALAMVLNSFGLYATSERSQRYTNALQGSKNIEYYNKWKEIIYNRIGEVYPDLKERRKQRLAMENARYFLSVLDETTSLVYTTSYRQWSYIASVFRDTNEYYQKSGKQNFFDDCLIREMREFAKEIIDNSIGTFSITNTKHRKLDFLAHQVDSHFLNAKESFGDVYLTKYMCSFSCLAQLERHRTLNYYMDFDGEPEFFYVPPILSLDLQKEWLEDMYKIAYTIPQGTMINVIECGTTENFLLKCKERLCGRAQLEAMNVTKEVLDRLFLNEATDYLKEYYIKGERAKVKCELLGSCKEPCEFNSKNALNRLI